MLFSEALVSQCKFSMFYIIYLTRIKYPLFIYQYKSWNLSVFHWELSCICDLHIWNFQQVNRARNSPLWISLLVCFKQFHESMVSIMVSIEVTRFFFNWFCKHLYEPYFSCNIANLLFHLNCWLLMLKVEKLWQKHLIYTNTAL